MCPPFGYGLRVRQRDNGNNGNNGRTGKLMGSRFRVETQELGQFLRNLGNGRADMEKALNALRDIDPKSTGSVALDHACDEFHDSWDDAIRMIVKGTQQIEEKLKATKNNYEETEQAIQDAMSKGGAPTNRPTSRPTDPSSPPPDAKMPSSTPSPTPSPGPASGAR